MAGPDVRPNEMTHIDLLAIGKVDMRQLDEVESPDPGAERATCAQCRFVP